MASAREALYTQPGDLFTAGSARASKWEKRQRGRHCGPPPLDPSHTPPISWPITVCVQKHMYISICFRIALIHPGDNSLSGTTRILLSLFFLLYIACDLEFVFCLVACINFVAVRLGRPWTRYPSRQRHFSSLCLPRPDDRVLQYPFQERYSTPVRVRTGPEQLTELPKDSPACRKEAGGEQQLENSADQSSQQMSSISCPA